MAGHFTTRIWTHATAPLVREIGPAVTHFFRTITQLVGFAFLAGLILIIIHFAPDAIPDTLIKIGIGLLALIPMLFGFLVVADQVMTTYQKATEVIYPHVPAFDDREPPEIPEEDLR